MRFFRLRVVLAILAGIGTLTLALLAYDLPVAWGLWLAGLVLMLLTGGLLFSLMHQSRRRQRQESLKRSETEAIMANRRTAERLRRALADSREGRVHYFDNRQEEP